MLNSSVENTKTYIVPKTNPYLLGKCISTLIWLELFHMPMF